MLEAGEACAAEKLANQGVQFIATCEQLRAVQTFLDGL
jgi:hypothetical protein